VSSPHAVASTPAKSKTRNGLRIEQLMVGE
jgi:hypothetical protein